jgi:hypothetical protein
VFLRFTFGFKRLFSVHSSALPHFSLFTAAFSLSRDGIMAMSSPWIAGQEPAHGQEKAAKWAMLFQGIYRVNGAGGLVAA